MFTIRRCATAPLYFLYVLIMCSAIYRYSFSWMSIKLIIILLSNCSTVMIFFRFTLHLACSRVGRGNLVAVLRYSLIFGTKHRAVTYQSEEIKINYDFFYFIKIAMASQCLTMKATVAFYNQCADQWMETERERNIWTIVSLSLLC